MNVYYRANLGRLPRGGTVPPLAPLCPSGAPIWVVELGVELGVDWVAKSVEEFMFAFDRTRTGGHLGDEVAFFISGFSGGMVIELIQGLCFT